MQPAGRKLKVLFLCTGNSCRSQMAEGFARQMYAERIEAWSAGTIAKGIDARAVRVMAESGVDISEQYSKSLDELRDKATGALPEFDLVITVCDAAREACPVFPGRTRLYHHSFDDPPVLARGAATEEEALAHYRRVRDEILAFVTALPELLKAGRDVATGLPKEAGR